jgi:hypothetical protein
MFKSKSLEGILSSFTQVQSDLQDFVGRANAQRDNHLEEADFHAKAAVAKTAEITRAENVMEKITQLVS